MTPADEPPGSDTRIDAREPAAPSSVAHHLLSHGAVFVLLALSLYWLQAAEPTAGSLALYTGAVWGFIAGMALSHLIHEWAHYLGATGSGATVLVKRGYHPLFFDFVFEANSPRQFLVMSIGGLLGNLALLAAMLALALPDSLVLKSALAAVVGQLVFVIILELPVSMAVAAGSQPYVALEQHFSQGGPLFLRAASLGAAAAALVLVWY